MNIRITKRYTRFIYNFCCRPRKNFVHIVSAMRSGSTLLKALLAEAPDVSNLPEFDVYPLLQFHSLKRYLVMATRSHKKIIVFKQPPLLGFQEKHPYRQVGYPYIPFKHDKIILLVRNAADAVLSLETLLKATAPREYYLAWGIEKLVDYWCVVYDSALKTLRNFNPDQVYCLRYEDLVAEPKKITQALYAFIGSKKNEGVDSYSQPKNFFWRWGLDDAGELIKSLKVSGGKRHPENEVLKEIIKNSPRLRDIYQKFGYSFPDGQPLPIQQSEVVKSIFTG